jgi:hypothetical protein
VHYINSEAIEGDDGSFVRVKKNGASNLKIEASKAKILFLNSLGERDNFLDAIPTGHVLG